LDGLKDKLETATLHDVLVEVITNLLERKKSLEASKMPNLLLSSKLGA